MYVYYNRKKNKGLKIFFYLFLISGITLITLKQIYAEKKSYAENEIQKEEIEIIEKVEQKPKYENETENFVEIIKRSMPSIVGINVLKPDGDGILDLQLTEKWGIGTGIVLSTKGYILTNQHLASKRNSTINVKLEDEEVKGKVIWNEENLDLAIIKIPEKNNLVPIKIGDSNNCQIGEDVIAIGNPLGNEFQKSVTKGIISGLNRTLKVEDKNSTIIMEDLIQTDASINNGNSGGPLINKKGEVIGINTVKITSAEGIGFAVPINIIENILTKLELDGEFNEGYMGIWGYDSKIIPFSNKKINLEKGIYVSKITKNSPAQKNDIKIGDVILKVDNNNVEKMLDLRRYIYLKNPGDKISLEIMRNNEKIVKEIILSKK